MPMYALALTQSKDYIGFLLWNGIGSVVFLILYAFAKPDITGHKLLAFFISLLDAFVMFHRTGIDTPFVIILAPLALIWFAEFLGTIRANTGPGGNISTDTPEWMVAGFGWIVLLVMSWFIFNGLDSNHMAQYFLRGDTP